MKNKSNRRAALPGDAVDTVVPSVAAELRPGQSVALLQELHILTRDGKMNQDSRRKLKQVYHLYQFIEKILLELADPAASTSAPGGRPAGVSVADHGAGKSYLGFILYDLYFRSRRDGWIYGKIGRAHV